MPLILAPMLISRRKSTFRVLGADFDGANDHMAKAADFAGNADAKKLLMSFWFRIDGGDGTTRFIAAEQADLQFVQVRLHTDNTLRFDLGNSSFTVNFRSSALAASATWHHALMSVDFGITGGGATRKQLYIDDVSDLTNVNDGDIDFSIELTNGGWTVGTNYPAAGPGVGRFNGALAEFWMKTGTSLDLSVTGNRRLFRTADGKPADLGADGSLPGFNPIAYFSLRPGDAASAFATNRGTGGDMTITGTLDLASTNPSD